MRIALVGMFLFFAMQAGLAATVAHYASAEIAQDFAPIQIALNR